MYFQYARLRAGHRRTHGSLHFKAQRLPDVHREHPDPQSEKQYGGWTLVLHYLRARKYREAFQLNRFLIVQVDTDIAEDPGFDVPRRNSDGELSIPDFVAAVIARLKREIGDADLATYADRFIFAIGVEQLECWILPLWFSDSRCKQTVNCTDRLSSCNNLRNELSKKNYPWIRKEEKNPSSYDISSRDYRKRQILLSKGPSSPSLAIFLNDLDERKIELPPSE
jgi:hypothetical protein